ncbi:hypothetical protein SGQ44_13435 [Flavobacterium sp. Fl-77]|uniref:Uncharacterized protein n=1 Tax=Flavobacterium flavipigmentatum TaxID=2893884 RepID=A0AAJ2SHX0_9FLAO|nr:MULTISPECIES: hypothetical protein [unclassified Flavobacterium]MDX6183165.1 hypothetical protein [Flavobacterium sp. Fl-33]MDX6186766.1 hypothetical protein [Flavobacterium sp. Fl-77]UFH40420.1 hypothetical protein LNP22_09115 [Flavobacterium sp. F-70]
MKNKLFIPGLIISIALLTFSCTNDDYQVETNSGNQSKTVTKDQLQKLNATTKVRDSISNDTIPQVNNLTEGDPIIPRPPRKD